MRSTTIAATLMAMASAVTAQKAGFAVFANPAMDEVVFAGKPYTLKWTAGKDATGKDYAGPATLTLIGGETQGTQQFVANLTSKPILAFNNRQKSQPVLTMCHAALDVSANTYAWNVDCTLGKAKVYGLSITLNNEPATFQWSNRFHIDNSGCPGENGNPGSASSSASSSAVASATSAPSSGGAYPTATSHASASSAAVTSSHSSAAATVSSAAVPTLTKSSSAGATTSSATKPAATASQSSTGATPIPTAAAPKVAAGSLALAGAAIAAVLAL